mmetsp:Transcript_18225/g.30196  ORF Transcript_18225/g.30196 Transcript_18225/m.30196 type:complete len:99 (-) Transcript_18225:823-1119(-)
MLGNFVYGTVRHSFGLCTADQSNHRHRSDFNMEREMLNENVQFLARNDVLHSDDFDRYLCYYFKHRPPIGLLRECLDGLFAALLFSKMGLVHVVDCQG